MSDLSTVSSPQIPPKGLKPKKTKNTPSPPFGKAYLRKKRKEAFQGAFAVVDGAGSMRKSGVRAWEKIVNRILNMSDTSLESIEESAKQAFVLHSLDLISELLEELRMIDTESAEELVRRCLSGLHLLKGGAGFVKMADVRGLAGELETVLRDASEGPAKSQGLAGALRQVVEGLERMSSLLQESEPASSR